MARFQHGRSPAQRRGTAAAVILFLVILAIFLGSINSFSSDTLRRQEENLENALQRSITYCYAAEGAYPQDLDYLKEHYGLTWDEDSFFVDYQVRGSNIYPDVTIIQRKGAAQ
jgi:hypothetical protein